MTSKLSRLFTLAARAVDIAADSDNKSLAVPEGPTGSVVDLQVDQPDAGVVQGLGFAGTHGAMPSLARIAPSFSTLLPISAT